MLEKTAEIIEYINTLLAINTFKDYAPNGLQVEGKPTVAKVVTGVTANLALLEAAVDAGADLVIVHHGYFWPNEDQRIIGMKKRRIETLIKHDINLAGYHIPLDAHRTLGNNVQLAEKLSLNTKGYAGKGDLLAYGELPATVDALTFSQDISKALQREPLLVGPSNKHIKRVAWCTGAAQSYIESAVELGVDAFISGEISEQTTHIANESNMVYFSAGHHATERYGVIALGNHLADKFDIQHQFIDIDNPV